ncbi:pimeloyl-ACP methyl ester carboxylesterase [Haloferula luteola]|uniref:Pimeloyl-ACP methyl ester carboxylesterase n=1 Tax=Haloferula luteola TaxID=595692 RepID=A0A840VC94_9BACT|nr:alpha/beta hydrolase [Haloferula luteola]MBB5353164.1 pimeloyl-ACP methyl ester carboxylesterase [Haloferula luteola]
MKAALVLASCLTLASPLFAEAFPALDARLSNYEYPFEVKIRTFEAQGQDLEMAYMDETPEKPNGHTVLLLHGKNFSGAYWEKTARLLMKEGFRVIMPDQIGFGKSSKPLEFQYSFQALATQTHDLLKDLGVDRVDVVGHSMGGMVAARFALMFPAVCEKLVLVNPIGLEDWKRMVPYQPIDDAVAAEMKKDDEAVRNYMSKAYFDGKWESSWDPLLAIQAGWTKGPAKELMAKISAITSDMVFTQPVIDEFPDIKVPTLLVIGERDRTAIGKNRADAKTAAKMGQYQRLGQKAANAIPGSTYVALPGIGHVPQVEAFQEYAKALVGFLKK